MANEASAWEIAAAVGQVVAAAAAVAGLIFVGIQVRTARRTADLQALQTFTKNTVERESNFLNARDETIKQQAFVEFLNFLETNAAAFNGGLFAPITRKIACDSLVNAICAIQHSPLWANRFEDAIRTSSTFAELGTFIARHRADIRKVAQEMTAHRVGSTA